MNDNDYVARKDKVNFLIDKFNAGEASAGVLKPYREIVVVDGVAKLNLQYLKEMSLACAETAEQDQQITCGLLGHPHAAAANE